MQKALGSPGGILNRIGSSSQIAYRLADVGAQEGIPFVSGHALYMKAIHCGKAKNDKIKAHKLGA